MLGICFSIFSSVTCRWFVLVSPESATSHWDFLPTEATEARSEMNIGLYKYEQFDTESCVPYSRSLLWRGPDGIYSWMFTSQLCVVLGPIVAFLAVITLLFGKMCCLFTSRQQRWMACCLLLLAAGLQWACMVASIAWCGSFWDCAWLAGANMNVSAAFFFTLAWALAICCFDYRNNAVDSEDRGGLSLDDDDDLKKGDDCSIGTYEGEIIIDEMEDVELGTPALPVKRKGSLLARELLGTNDPIIFSAVAQGAMAIREFAQNQMRRESVVSAEKVEAVEAVEEEEQRIPNAAAEKTKPSSDAEADGFDPRT